MSFRSWLSRSLPVHRALAAQLRPVVAASLVAVVAAAGFQGAHPKSARAATTYEFIGAGEPSHSQWTNPGNWNPSGPPGPGDDAVIRQQPGGPASVTGIPAGTVLHGLTLATGGSLRTGDLTVTSSFSWTGGTLYTPLTVPAGGVVGIAGADTKFLSAGLPSSGTLNIAGATTLSGPGVLSFTGTAILNNTGSFTAQPGASMAGGSCCLSPAQFNNRGSFNVPAGSGRVLISNMSYNDSGPTTVGAGSTFELQWGPSTWSDGVSFSGSGRTLIDRNANPRLLGNVVLNGGHVLELGADPASGGAGLISGSGTLSGSGSFVWSAGQLTGSLGVGASVATTISGAPTKRLVQDSGTPGSGVLSLAGRTDFSGPGALDVQGAGAAINNTGTFTARPGAIINGNGGRFGNSGTLVNDAAGGTSTINGLALANSGTIELASGVLRVNSPTFDHPAGAALKVAIAGTVPGAGFGQLQVSGGATFSGNLALKNTGGFVPAPGQTVTVVTCGTTCGGAFANVTVNYLAQYNPQDVTLIPLISIGLDPPDATIDQGTTLQYLATGTYGDDSFADLTASLFWSSSDSTVATIDQTGLATGAGPGVASISATVDTISGTTTLSVTPPPPPP